MQDYGNCWHADSEISSSLPSSSAFSSPSAAYEPSYAAFSTPSRQREDAPAPSLRGGPDRKDIDSVWEKRPRTMQDALRLGSRLLDLEPTVDNSCVWKENPHTGRREVDFRHAGIKGWLQWKCPAVPYGTAMRYKKLASRLRTVCGLPGSVPLEWLLPDSPMPPAEGLDGKTLAAIEKGAGRAATVVALPPSPLPRRGREETPYPARQTQFANVQQKRLTFVKVGQIYTTAIPHLWDGSEIAPFLPMFGKIG